MRVGTCGCCMGCFALLINYGPVYVCEVRGSWVVGEYILVGWPRTIRFVNEKFRGGVVGPWVN